jgi:hypothetical protein
VRVQTLIKAMVTVGIVAALTLLAAVVTGPAITALRSRARRAHCHYWPQVCPTLRYFQEEFYPAPGNRAEIHR